MEKRCPWCGEHIEKPQFSSLGEYRCRCCGKKSVMIRHRLAWLIPAVFSLLMILLIRSAWAACSLSLLVLSVYYDSIIAPLERIPRKYVPIKTAEAKAKLAGEWSFFKKRTVFIGQRILIITFVNEEKEAISHTIAVSVDDISFDEEELTFRISFMPKNRKFCGFPAGTAFYLFEGKQRIAEGVLMTAVNYPRIDSAELPE